MTVPEVVQIPVLADAGADAVVDCALTVEAKASAITPALRRKEDIGAMLRSKDALVR